MLSFVSGNLFVDSITFAYTRLQITHTVFDVTLTTVTAVKTNITLTDTLLAFAMVVAFVFTGWVLTKTTRPPTKTCTLSCYANTISRTVFSTETSIAVRTTPPWETINAICTVVQQHSMNNYASRTIGTCPSRVAATFPILSTGTTSFAFIRTTFDFARGTDPSGGTVTGTSSTITLTMSAALIIGRNFGPSRTLMNLARISRKHQIAFARSVQTCTVAAASTWTCAPVAVFAQASTPTFIAATSSCCTIAHAVTAAAATRI